MRIARTAPALALIVVVSGCASQDASTQAAPEESASTRASSGAADDAAAPESSAESGSAGDSDGTQPSEQPAPGAYIDWDTYAADRAAYQTSDVVLFFHADWCPSCQETQASLEADGVPDGLTVVKVDFDNATDLRQEYGVTLQHTFVHVDADGQALKTWTGATTGADIAAGL